MKDFLSLIILYFTYICSADGSCSAVSYGLAGVHITGTTTLNGGHSCQNLPEMGEVLPNQGEIP